MRSFQRLDLVRQCSINNTSVTVLIVLLSFFFFFSCLPLHHSQAYQNSLTLGTALRWKIKSHDFWKHRVPWQLNLFVVFRPTQFSKEDSATISIYPSLASFIYSLWYSCRHETLQVFHSIFHMMHVRLHQFEKVILVDYQTQLDAHHARQLKVIWGNPKDWIDRPLKELMLKYLQQVQTCF